MVKECMGSAGKKETDMYTNGKTMNDECPSSQPFRAKHGQTNASSTHCDPRRYRKSGQVEFSKTPLQLLGILRNPKSQLHPFRPMQQQKNPKYILCIARVFNRPTSRLTATGRTVPRRCLVGGH